jgi:glycosyltransferase involved in cell wall biosynthesis
MVGARQESPRSGFGVSVVIPCHNGARYLGDTIRSVLRQGSDVLEIIVVDDGSTDGSREVVAAFDGAVHYVHQARGGAARARNRGVEHASGALLAFLDADDLWSDRALASLMAPLERDPALGMTVGLMEQFVSPELPDGARHGFRFSPEAVPARMCGAVLVRRSEFDRVGGFSPQLESGEFTDWILRAEAAGLRFVTVPELVLRRRLHLQNHGVVRRDARRDYLKVVKAALDRRRAAAEPEHRP